MNRKGDTEDLYVTHERERERKGESLMLEGVAVLCRSNSLKKVEPQITGCIAVPRCAWDNRTPWSSKNHPCHYQTPPSPNAQAANGAINQYNRGHLPLHIFFYTDSDIKRYGGLPYINWTLYKMQLSTYHESPTGNAVVWGHSLDDCWDSILVWNCCMRYNVGCWATEIGSDMGLALPSQVVRVRGPDHMQLSWHLQSPT